MYGDAMEQVEFMEQVMDDAMEAACTQLDVWRCHGASRVHGASHGRCHGRDIALAIVVSCDPKFKLDDAEIANEFWVVHVDMALMKTEDLVRSRKSCNTLDNAGKKDCMAFNLYSKDMWILICVHGKCTAMMMMMFQFMMMMMFRFMMMMTDAFNFS